MLFYACFFEAARAGGFFSSDPTLRRSASIRLITLARGASKDAPRL
jgi:hypothetical protein